MTHFTAAAAMVLVTAAAAAGQTTTLPGRSPAGAVEMSAGWAGFVDDAMINHLTVGGTARTYVTRRLSIGPEVQYMRGPRSDRDLFVTGNLTFDVAGDRGSGRLTPFLVVGGGLMRHSDRFGAVTFSSTEGAFTAGGGLRVRAERLLAGVDARCGWELHCRVAGTVGVAFGG